MGKNKEKIKELESQIASINKRRNELFEVRKPIDEELRSTYDSLKLLKEQKETLLLEDYPKVNWDWLLSAHDEDGSEYGMVHYYACEKALHNIGLMSSGCWEETNQRTIMFTIEKNPKSLKKVLKGIKKILPFLKKDKNGIIRYTFMSDRLEGFGSMEQDGDTFTVKASYYSIGSKFNSLENALKHIQERYPYGTWREDNES